MGTVSPQGGEVSPNTHLAASVDGGGVPRQPTPRLAESRRHWSQEKNWRQSVLTTSNIPPTNAD